MLTIIFTLTLNRKLLLTITAFLKHSGHNNFRVILLGDFSAPGFNGESVSPLPNCTAILNSTCFLGLRQSIEVIDNLILLDLVFANFTDLNSVPADSSLVKPLSNGVYLPHVNTNLNCEFSYQNFVPGNYILLHKIFFHI
jgi:hypothetical protein